MANRTPRRPDITKEQVVSLYRTGLTTHEIARTLACSSRTVLLRLQGAQEPLPPPGRTKRYPIESRASRNARSRRWKAEHPERVAAWNRGARAVRQALRKGILLRPDICENCGIPAKEPPQAAHENYDRPLDVRWLCRNCHMIWDSDHPKSAKFERKE
jgi:hypothetical protein